MPETLNTDWGAPLGTHLCVDVGNHCSLGPIAPALGLQQAAPEDGSICTAGGTSGQRWRRWQRGVAGGGGYCSGLLHVRSWPHLLLRPLLRLWQQARLPQRAGGAGSGSG